MEPQQPEKWTQKQMYIWLVVHLLTLLRTLSKHELSANALITSRKDFTVKEAMLQNAEDHNVKLFTLHRKCPFN